MTDTVKYQQVLTATRDYMAKVPADARPAKVTTAYWDIGKEMGVGLYDQATRQDNANAGRFFAQIRRALDALATEGTLVKIGKGDRNPEGCKQGTPLYYTQAQYESAMASAQEKHKAAREDSQRWADIRNRLEWRGISSLDAPGLPVRLDLAGWDAVLAQLAGGREGRGGW